MALVFMEGFDVYNSTNDLLAGSFTGTTGTTGFVTGRSGQGKAFSLGASGSLTKTNFLGTSVLTVTFGFALCQTASSGSAPQFFIGLLHGSSLYFSVSFYSDGSVGCGSNAHGVPGNNAYGLSIGTPNSDNKSGNWHYVEIQANDAGTGAFSSFTVKLDGVNILAGRNLSFGGGSWGTTVSNLFLQASGSSSTQTFIDDLYFCDDQGGDPIYTDFLGVCQITTLFPTANGTYTQFTPVPGTNANWQNVSETGVDYDATYNTASFAGTKDTFMSNGSFGAQTILAVQPKIFIRQDDNATRSMQTWLKSGATEVGGANTVMAQTYKFATDIYTHDPATSTTWTANGVSGLEFGYNIVS
jgi:hypothetical protein